MLPRFCKRARCEKLSTVWIGRRLGSVSAQLHPGLILCILRLRPFPHKTPLPSQSACQHQAERLPGIGIGETAFSARQWAQNLIRTKYTARLIVRIFECFPQLAIGFFPEIEHLFVAHIAKPTAIGFVHLVAVFATRIGNFDAEFLLFFHIVEVEGSASNGMFFKINPKND